ncbi:MAG: hypothetical protein MK510_02125 [SAR324 cluster bacterium]|nr:hypothetical protein [SAR324 cluster bacterium]
MKICDNNTGFVNQESSSGAGFGRNCAVVKIVVNRNIADVDYCSATSFVDLDVFLLVTRITGNSLGLDEAED